MITHSTIALTGFITWALLLLVLMEVMRTQLVLRGKVPANGFTPDNANLSPFMQRLARAHANCVESLPVFGGLLLVAIAHRAHFNYRPARLSLPSLPCLSIACTSDIIERNCRYRSLHSLCCPNGNRPLLGLQTASLSVRPSSSCKADGCAARLDSNVR